MICLAKGTFALIKIDRATLAIIKLPSVELYFGPDRTVYEPGTRFTL
jgi:hypothetical protein